MKKHYLIICMLAITAAFAQTSEKAPVLQQGGTSQSTPNYVPFSTLTTSFLYDVGAIAGASNAGVVYLNGTFWVSVWNSADIHEISSTGTLVQTFQITGVSQVRSMTTDGTNIYCGAAGASIYVVDPSTKTLTSTISISTTSDASARFCTYDASLDSGNGGFWIGNFGSDIASVSMTGAELSVIPAATHGLSGMYGAAAYDDGTNHYLFVYNQGTTSGDEIEVLDLATGTLTGINYDFFANDASGAGSTSSLAGGLFLSTDVVSGQNTLVGVSQATPSNLLFGLNVDNVLNTTTFDSASNFTVYPNPVKDYLNVATKDNTTIKEATLFNILGTQVLKTNNLLEGRLDLSGLSAGSYFLSLKDENNGTATIKVIKQ